MRLTEEEIRVAMKIKVGDSITIQPLWNRTERKDNQIPTPAIVEEVVFPTVSQSGISFVVKAKGGGFKQLDAAWFIIRRLKQAELDL